jgi:hypothetical protein
MAVEKSKVIARLKVLFPKANLSQQRLDAIADKLAKKPADDADETAIDAVINDFNDVLSIEDIAKGDDRTRTLEADKKKAEELAAGKKADSSKDDDKEEIKIDDDAPAWAKAILKSNEKLTSELESIKSGNVQKSKLDQAKSLLEKSEVFKKLDEETKGFMLKNVDLESETTFEDQITGLEGMFGKMVQTTADANQYAPGAGQGKPSNAVDEKLVGDIVENM